jgi:hypothetical protein
MWPRNEFAVVSTHTRIYIREISNVIRRLMAMVSSMDVAHNVIVERIMKELT